ncbi:MAG: hypothetical protein AAGI37_15340 [Planctomycetota bacterium]
MSRIALMVGLVISVALHAWLLSWPAVPRTAAKPVAVPIAVTPPIPTPQPRPESGAPARPVDEPPAPPRSATDTTASQKRSEPAASDKALIASSSEAYADRLSGDLAGDPSGERRLPRVRIDWGDPADALSLIDSAGLRLVVLDVNGRDFTSEALKGREGQWRLVSFRVDGARRYASRLRVVDDVPAFQAVARALDLDHGQRLALLLPLELEQRIAAQIARVAVERGHMLSAIRTVGVRVLPGPSGPRLVVTHVQLRS